MGEAKGFIEILKMWWTLKKVADSVKHGTESAKYTMGKRCVQAGVHSSAQHGSPPAQTSELPTCRSGTPSSRTLHLPLFRFGDSRVVRVCLVFGVSVVSIISELATFSIVSYL